MAISIFSCLFKKGIWDIIFIEDKIKYYLVSFGTPTKKFCVPTQQSNSDKMGLFALNLWLQKSFGLRTSRPIVQCVLNHCQSMKGLQGTLPCGPVHSCQSFLQRIPHLPDDFSLFNSRDFLTPWIVFSFLPSALSVVQNSFSLSIRGTGKCPWPSPLAIGWEPATIKWPVPLCFYKAAGQFPLCSCLT